MESLMEKGAFYLLALLGFLFLKDLLFVRLRPEKLVTRAELACAWEVLAADRKPVPTWELADRLIEAGCAGIIVPSFAARAGERDINLVLWRWTRDKPHKVTVVDDDNRLPKDRSSWQ